MSLFSPPNNLTSARLVLSFALFGCISLHAWTAGLVVFALAAITDWLDGQVARRMGLVSSLGRVYDPVVDKILMGGAFIFLLEQPASGLNAWMVTIVIAREFLVTALRGFLEEKGVAFGADQLGKIKMAVQCAAVIWILFAFARFSPTALPAYAILIRDILNWSAVGLTFISGAQYVIKAIQWLR